MLHKHNRDYCPVKSFKILSAQEDMRLNQLLEEAIQDLLKKYKKKSKK